MKLKYLIMMTVSLLLIVLMINSGLCQRGGPMNGGNGRPFDEDLNANDMMGMGQTLRQSAGMHGMGFMHSGAGLYGQYLTFDVDDTTGVITNYSIAGVEVFDSIVIDGFDYDSTQVSGAMTWIADTYGTTFIQIHDNPMAVINMVFSRDHTINFHPAEGTTVSTEDNIITIEAGGIQVSDIVVHIIYAPGDSVEVSENNDLISITSEGDSAVIVRAVPVNMHRLDNVHRMLVREIAGNRVGADVSLGKDGSISVVNYAKDMHVRLQSMTPDMIRLQVNSTDPAGKIMAFNLDNTSLMLRERDWLGIHYDGTPMACVSDPELIFNATGATCWVSQQTRERAQVMMYIPEFSVHTIEIVVESEEEAEIPKTTDTGIPGFEAVMTVLGLLLTVYVSEILRK